jgi:hypothetical protein
MTVKILQPYNNCGHIIPAGATMEVSDDDPVFRDMIKAGTALLMPTGTPARLDASFYDNCRPRKQQ